MSKAKSWEYSQHMAEARKAAAQALVDAGITSLPVDPFQFCAQFGVTVLDASQEDEPLPAGVAGSTVYDGQDFRVVLGPTANFGFLNFTLAHELGHVSIESHQTLFTGNRRHLSGDGFSGDEIKERQADHFAASFLMPEKLCRTLLNGIPDSDAGLKSIEVLQRECNVSLTAAAIRYAELTSHLAAVVVSTNGKVDYCIRSSELVDQVGFSARIPKGALLPAYTPSLALSNDLAAIEAAKTKDNGDIRWDMWFGSDRGEVFEEAKGLGKYGKVLTVLTANE